jgi:hypothetical protein
MKALRISRSRFTRPVFLWAAAALLAEVGVRQVSGAYARWMGLLPAVLMLFFIWAAVRMMMKMDELQQRICLESFSIAFLLTLALTIVLAGLERAGAYRARGDDLGTQMMVLWACSYLFSAWRYR